MFVNTTYFMTG